METQKPYFIIDFDSTFTQVEAMEELAAISLKNDPDRELIIEKIRQLTDLAMDGKMPFPKSLKARIALLSAKKYHIQMLVNRLRKRVSVSFARNKNFFKAYQGQILIVSGGFKEFIEPVVKPYGVNPEQVFANTFLFDKKNNIIGADETNVLAMEQGKVKLLKQLKLKGRVIAIGDGYTDYELLASGQVQEFFAFTENIARPLVIQKAKRVASSLDEILYQEKLPMAISYPKSRIKAVLWGEPCYEAENELKKEGYQIYKVPANANFSMLSKIRQANLLVFHPAVAYQKVLTEMPTKQLATAVWGEVINPEFSSHLALSGTALISPAHSHSRSVAELALLMMLNLFRQKQEELLGKTLGIIGYGHSGSLLSLMAANLGMQVLYFDKEERPPLGNAMQLKTPQEVIRKADALVVLMDKTYLGNFALGLREIKQIKSGSILIHLSYDELIDPDAVKQMLEQQKLGGFAMDCLNERTFKKIHSWKNTFITLNERLNTHQTSTNIANAVCKGLIDFVNTGSTSLSENFPRISLPPLQTGHRFIHIHKNVPGVLARINSILAESKTNISGQYLKTNDEIGYVITDVDNDYSENVLQELKRVPSTIRFRVLY